MDFDFTEEQSSLRATVRSWVDKGFPFSRRHAIAKAGGKTREIYAELAELGLTGLSVPEAHGGLGLGAIEAMVVMEELGRGLVNAPYAQGALIAPALLRSAPADVQAKWLPKVADGSALIVLAHQERHARYNLNDVTTKATEKNGSWVLDGVKSIVPAGDEADALIVPARVSGAQTDSQGIALFLVEKSAATLRAYPTQDGARAAELTLKATPATLLTKDGLETLQRAVDVGVTAVCAEGVGLMDKLFVLTVEYMKTRKQFGVAIATFQALRHKAADVKMQLELARSMSYFATLKASHPDSRRALAQSRVQVGNAMRIVGQQCVQLHGGIGVTDEYVGSHYFKRLSILEVTFGDTMHHTAQVSAQMTDTAGVFI